ncbi:CAP domain-containing protein [Actinoplanes sp. NPDC051861]|uniref:CAP domain-containing protein n=1 Tax=Actinoplanes sp. NPDC051861 TaxID=3155170 RepID=UPI00341F9883
MFDLVVRRVALLAATPALFVLSAPAVAHGPVVPPRPMRLPAPAALPQPDAQGPVATPRTPIVTPSATATATATATAAATTAPVTTTAAPAATPSARLRARAMMSEVVKLTNERRAAAGCPALSVDRNLITASLRQSWYMARTRLFSHVWRDGSTFVTRTRAAGYRQPAGENIAWGYRSVPDVMDAWMESPGHRANILNCGAKSIGTGVAWAADGTPYYTQVFGWK